MSTAAIYIVAGRRPWDRLLYQERLSGLDGVWHFIGHPEKLTKEHVQALSPRYLFFLNWSWKVPDEIVADCECVCFHMTDVPYGRGGSPLQNLILRGHRETKLSALRMNESMDAGPVYAKRPLSLEGSAEEIYLRAGKVSASMIEEIVTSEPDPIAQTGEPVVFKRRDPSDSRISGTGGLEGLFDFIRMLDAADYPNAFLEAEGFRFEFSRASVKTGHLVADVTITRVGGRKDQ